MVFRTKFILENCLHIFIFPFMFVRVRSYRVFNIFFYFEMQNLRSKMSKKLKFFLFLVANFRTFYGDKTKLKNIQYQGRYLSFSQSTTFQKSCRKIPKKKKKKKFQFLLHFNFSFFSA